MLDRMRSGLPCVLPLLGCALAGLADSGAAQGATAPPAPDSVVRARIALRTDALARCPDLRHADAPEGTMAVLLFHVGPTGVPSQVSIKASSGSADLDNAATQCVLKLRFQPATRMGDGAPIDSWQEMAWRWALKPTTTPAAAAPAAAPPVAAPAPAPRAAANTAERPGAVRVRVCVDAAGKLAREPAIVASSGDAQFDAAALNLARSGSGHYPTKAAAGGQSPEGCLEVAIRSLP